MKLNAKELHAIRGACLQRVQISRLAMVGTLTLLLGCHEPRDVPSSIPPVQNSKGPSLVFVSRATHLASPPLRAAQIVAIDLNSHQQRVLFSDKDQPFRLETAGLAANSVFAYVGAREPWATVKWEGGRSRPIGYAMLELALKAPPAHRKIFEPLGENVVSQIFVHPQGQKIGYVAPLGRWAANDNYRAPRRMVFIHRTDTGQLLHRFELVTPPCHRCELGTIGWYDDRRLHYSLTAPPEDYIGDSVLTDRLGIYTVNEDGSELAKLPAKFFLTSSKPSLREGKLIPENIGVLMTGKLLVMAPPVAPGAPVLLYPVDLSRGVEAEYVVSTDAFGFKLPYPGRYLVYQQRDLNGAYLWVKNLETSVETRLLQLPEGEFQVLGWLNP